MIINSIFKLRSILFLFILILISSLSFAQETCFSVLQGARANSLLKISNLPYGVPDYDSFNLSDIIPAYKQTITQAKIKIREIRGRQELPTFENSIKDLEDVLFGFEQLDSYTSALGSLQLSDEVSEVIKEKTELVGYFERDLYTDAELFRRVEHLYERPQAHSQSQNELINIVYQRFIDSGMSLLSRPNGQDLIQRIAQIKTKVIQLGTEYNKNINTFVMSFAFIIENETDLKGLSESSIAKAKANAIEKGLEEKWIFLNTDGSALDVPSESDIAEIRARFFEESFPEEDFANFGIAKEISQLRHELALIMGFNSYAELSISPLMAQTPKVVTDLVDDLVELAKEPYEQASAELKAFYREQTGLDTELPLSDVAYWSHKLHEAKENFDFDVVGEYFPRDKTFKKVFAHFEKSFNIKFIENNNIPKMHEDVIVYEVLNVGTGETLGVVYFDLYVRDEKKTGAHLSTIRTRVSQGDEKVVALARVMMNLSKDSSLENSNISLMSFSEVSTLFHEMGHLMEALFFDSEFPGLYQLVWDAIEIPSTLQELIFRDPRVLQSIAEHYEDGSALPDNILKLLTSRGAKNLAQSIMISAAQIKIDLKWNSEEGIYVDSVIEFESDILAQALPYATPRGFVISGFFSHTFSGAYPARYYSYLWSKIMASQIHDRIAEFEPYSEEYKSVMKDFVDKFLSRGRTRPALTSFMDFTGEEPSPELFVEALRITE